MRSLIAILSLLGAASLCAQPAVNLYLEPEANGVVFKTVPLSEVEALAPEHPVIGGKVNNDWYRIAYPGHYIGFVEIPETNKDGTFNPGARLFMRKSLSSHIIARIQVGDNAEIIDRSGNWATVAFKGKGHVYYQNPEIFPPLPSVAAANTAPTVTYATQRIAYTPAAASNAPGVAVSTIPVTQEGGEIIAVEELEEIPATAPTPRPKPAPAAKTGTSMISAQAPATPAAPPSVQQPVTPRRPVAPPPGYAPVAASSTKTEMLSREVPRLFEGTFNRVKGFNFDFFGPDYSYALNDPSGKRIAYVDIENALLVSPIEAYLDKPVIIEGVPEKIGGTVPIVIKAKFVRLTR